MLQAWTSLSSFRSKDLGGSWSAEGCRVVSSGSNGTVCECDHLTSFATLSVYDKVNWTCLHTRQLITMHWEGYSLIKIIFHLSFESNGHFYRFHAISTIPHIFHGSKKNYLDRSIYHVKFSKYAKFRRKFARNS